MNDIFNDINKQIMSLLLKNYRKIFIALDGRCSAGKTTLALKLKEHWGCNIFHMDDFYLPMNQRTVQSMKKPGGHMDFIRLQKEVLLPLKEKGNAYYRKFDCKKQKYKESMQVNIKDVNLVEGAYSCHPDLQKFYDLKIFLDIEKEVQNERLLKRENNKVFEQFQKKWIPMEEEYFNTYCIEKQCDLHY